MEKITISIIEKKVIEVSIHNNGAGIKTEDFELILINFINLVTKKMKPIGSGLVGLLLQTDYRTPKGTFG
jgi:signal transduction histidine kinase